MLLAELWGELDTSSIARETILAVWNASPCPMLLVTPNLVIDGANQRYAEVLSVRPEEIVGKQIFEVLLDNPDLPHVKSSESLRASFDRVIARHEPDMILSIRYDMRSPEGVFIERHWNFSTFPVIDPKTALLKHFMVTAVDVTSQLNLNCAREAKCTTEEANKKRRLFLTDSKRASSCSVCGFAAHAIAKSTTKKEVPARFDKSYSNRRQPATMDAETLLRRLTQREKEVLELAIEGQATKVIALNLGISARTVEVHRTKILTKASAHNFLEIARSFHGSEPKQTV